MYAEKHTEYSEKRRRVDELGTSIRVTIEQADSLKRHAHSLRDEQISAMDELFPFWRQRLCM